MKKKWLELAERCEKATKPDVELSEDIACASFEWEKITEIIEPYGNVPMMINVEGQGPMIAGDYTSSVDAISDLIDNQFPEIGYILYYNKSNLLWNAGLGTYSSSYVGSSGINPGSGVNRALALCATYCKNMYYKCLD